MPSPTFRLKIKDYDEDGRIVTIQEKEMYNLDGQKTAADGVREPIKGIKTFEAPQMTSAISIKPDGRGRICKDALGYMHNNANNVQYNGTLVGLYGSPFAAAHGLPIMENNFNRVIALFAARKLIEQNWLNDNDEYMVPNEPHQDYQQYVNDSIVFSLFHSASNQSSLRNIQYKEKTWNIFNQFFFMSVEEMKSLATTHNFPELFNDTIGKTDSFVFKKLSQVTLSEDAQNILKMAQELVRKSFPLRQAAHEIAPEYHLNAWDQGWYAIRNGILKEQFKDDYKAFTDAYKAFGNRLRPLVYTLGFLKK